MGLSSSSELQEAASLLKNFRSRGRMLGGRPVVPRPGSLSSPSVSQRREPVAKNTPDTDTPSTESASRSESPVRAPVVRNPRPGGSGESKGGRIEEILESMCLRGGFQGAVIADEGGLAVAEYNCPVETDAVAACSSVLGSAMERAGRLLEQQEANHMTMDINYVDKVVLRQFTMEEDPYFLMIICPQEVDERSELEISIDRVVGVLARRN